MQLINKLKNVIQFFADRNYTLNVIYRILRDEFIWPRKKPIMTSFGFMLIGDKYTQTGDFEPEQIELVKHWFTQTDIFIDIGANIGFYSCLARSRGIRVIAIEPLNQNLRILYRNIKENHWSDVEILPIALADTLGTADLRGRGRIASLADGWNSNSNISKQTIAVNTLDNIISSRFDVQQMFIKVDVEGAEFNVLNGAKKMLQKMPKPIWLVEISMNSNFSDTFNIFWDNGYRVFTGDRRQQLVTKSELERWGKDGKVDFNCINWLCLPKELKISERIYEENTDLCP